eukprot:8134170-Pyramimonas_sp.AAC.2
MDGFHRLRHLGLCVLNRVALVQHTVAPYLRRATPRGILRGAQSSMRLRSSTPFLPALLQWKVT